MLLDMRKGIFSELHLVRDVSNLIKNPAEVSTCRLAGKLKALHLRVLDYSTKFVSLMIKHRGSAEISRFC